MRRTPTADRKPLPANPADYAFLSVRFAETTRMTGFTVRDLAVPVNHPLRNAINKGIVKGLRVYTAGRSIATTGGHADPTNGFRRDPMGDPVPKMVWRMDRMNAAKAVRQRYKEGSDLIKITLPVVCWAWRKASSNPQFTEEEIKAIVETAHDYGFRVAVHMAPRGMKAGHSLPAWTPSSTARMDDEAIAGLNNTVPGMYLRWPGAAVADSAKKPGFYPELVTPKALEIGPED